MNSASLSLFSTGATRGFIIEVGHGLSTTVPVFEGYILKHAMHNEYVAGDSIIKYLEQVIFTLNSILKVLLGIKKERNNNKG
jgi:actin-related protein